MLRTITFISNNKFINFYLKEKDKVKVKVEYFKCYEKTLSIMLVLYESNK